MALDEEHLARALDQLEVALLLREVGEDRQEDVGDRDTRTGGPVGPAVKEVHAPGQEMDGRQQQHADQR